MPAVNSNKVGSSKQEPLLKSFSKFQSSFTDTTSSMSRKGNSRSFSMYDKVYLSPSQRMTNRVVKSKHKRRMNEIDRATNLEHREKYRQLIEMYRTKTLAETESLLCFKSRNDDGKESKHIPTIDIRDTSYTELQIKRSTNPGSNKSRPTYLPPSSSVKKSATTTEKENVLTDTKDRKEKQENEKSSTSPGLPSKSCLTPSAQFSSISYQTPISKFFQSPNWFSPPSPYLCNTFVQDLNNTYGRRNRERKRKIQEEEIRSRLLQEKQDLKDEMLSQLLEERLKVKSVAEVGEISELTNEMESDVDNALVPNPGYEVLCERFNISITRQHISTLAKLNWLNDEIVNFYMELIVDRSKQLDNLPNAHAMNTFFFPKLSSQGYKSVRRWTKRVDIFSKDLIFFPIHLGIHWTLAVVDFGAKEILYLDSMGGSNPACLQTIKDYLVSESEDKKKSAFDVSDWKLINKSDKEIPQQFNGSDCGVFTCTFAEFLSRKASLSFTQSDMPLIRRTMVWEIINATLTR